MARFVMLSAIPALKRSHRKLEAVVVTFEVGKFPMHAIRFTPRKSLADRTAKGRRAWRREHGKRAAKMRLIFTDLEGARQAWERFEVLAYLPADQRAALEACLSWP